MFSVDKTVLLVESLIVNATSIKWVLSDGEMEWIRVKSQKGLNFDVFHHLENDHYRIRIDNEVIVYESVYNDIFFKAIQTYCRFAEAA